MDSNEICDICEMPITWNREIAIWESEDDRSCQQVGATIGFDYQLHMPR